MLGEEEKEEGEGSFYGKPLGKRMGIILAGPVMNIVLAMLLFSIIFFIVGTPQRLLTRLWKAIQPKYRDKARRQGCVYKRRRVESWEKLQLLVSASGERIRVSVNREGQIITFDVSPLPIPNRPEQ